MTRVQRKWVFALWRLALLAGAGAAPFVTEGPAWAVGSLCLALAYLAIDTILILRCK